MARAIIRYSFNKETSNTSGKAVEKVLEHAGFGKRGTASWELANGQLADIRNALLKVLDVCENPKEKVGRLDHLWIYIDQPDPEPSDI